MVLYPPWELVHQVSYPGTPGVAEYAGYHFVWSPPQDTGTVARVLLVQLGLQMAGAILVSILVTQMPWTKRLTVDRGT